ncbi:MAG: deoxyribodipyrimidine photo-lyase [Bacteroidetes bacterium]|nr:deoxyribodipyrimidine photo-lyase [Bacteroidota bacterium]
MSKNVAAFWFRRDLRLEDNAGLFHALKSGLPVITVFIFDENILLKLGDKTDKRVQFIHKTIAELKQELNALGSDLLVFHGDPFTVWQKLATEQNITKLYFNHDFEPYAKQRDRAVYDWFKAQGKKCFNYKDHVFYERNEVLKPDGTPYTVFTPFSKKWKARLADEGIPEYNTKEHFHNFFKPENTTSLIRLEELGFEGSEVKFPLKELNEEVVEHYGDRRDFPAINGTSRLSLHLRFGTVSIRQLVRKAQANEKFLNELIWRDFYAMILHHFPHVVGNTFKPQYDRIEWINNPDQFEKWCNGQTGIPIVDAGMRELNETGFMHNRVRMIVASFLVKNLFIDWRWGEAYFAEKLLDFDLASNNGGWQWAAGSGCDAAPYFRIFNPISQAQKFDPQFKYIKKWVPEVNTAAYPKPIVDLKESRERALERYAVVKG